MSAPHDVPDARMLVRAVREFMATELLPAVEGQRRYLTRVSINVLRTVERELELGEEHERRHNERLKRLGLNDEEELAAAIRRGVIDLRDREVLEAIRQSVRDKLSVANPDYLEENDETV